MSEGMSDPIRDELAKAREEAERRWPRPHYDDFGPDMDRELAIEHTQHRQTFVDGFIWAVSRRGADYRELIESTRALIQLVRERHYDMPMNTQLLLSQALDLAVAAERSVAALEAVTKP